MKLIAALLFLSVLTARAYTVTGSTYRTNGSQSDVASAVAAAPDGATITLPDGSFNWSSAVTVKKAVTIQAQDLPTNSDAGISNGNFNASRCNIVFGAGNGALFILNQSGAGSIVLAGINFQPGNVSGQNGLYLQVSGNQTTTPVIIHDCSFEVPDGAFSHPINWEASNGLLYWNRFFAPATCWSGCLYQTGSVPWTNKSSFGMLDAGGTINLYLEANIIDGFKNQGWDIGDNGRCVIRYNYIRNTQILTHGVTGTTGGRLLDVYNNKFKYEKVNGDWVAMSRWIWMRAGTARIHDNDAPTISQASGGYYGGGAWQFCNESLTRTGQIQTTCQKNSDYIGFHWCGMGGDGSKQISDPVRIWNNTGSGATAWSTNDQTGYGCDPQPGYRCTCDTFLLNRDIFLSAPGDGYQPYTYPHPLRGNLPQPSPTPTPSATPSPTPTPNPTATPSPTATPTPTPSPTPSPTPGGVSYQNWLNQLSRWIEQHPAAPDQN